MLIRLAMEAVEMVISTLDMEEIDLTDSITKTNIDPSEKDRIFVLCIAK